jgi:hypothetical protein
VRDNQPPPDASPDAALTCTVRDTIESCGASCTRCPPATDRATPTCDGIACGLSCTGGAPKCTDGSCSRLTWTFGSNMVDGLVLLAPAGINLAVRNRDGNLALAIDVPQLQGNEVHLQVPVCLTGDVQLQTRTLSATIFIADVPDSIDQYYMQASVPSPMTGAILKQASVPGGVTFIYSAPLSGSQFSNTTTTVVFQIGTLGKSFSGTIWVDDIEIE